MMTMILSAMGWFIFSYLYISIGEHKIHKNFMHRKILPAAIYERLPYVLDTYEAHGVRHHTQWFREFDYEPDELGREENLEIPLKETIIMIVVSSPLWLPIFYFSAFGGCIFLITAVVHNRLWSIFHRQMHIPKDVFFRDWALFRFLGRNHYMHHQDNSRNFNVVFPFADLLFGALATPSSADIREMLRLGYIKPKSRSVREILANLRQTTASQRQQTA